MSAIGILALQGGFAAHAAVWRALGVEPLLVRHAFQLHALDALVIPGGESTTLLNLMGDEDWFAAIRSFHARGGALLGTCAGAILLARRVVPAQPSLGLLDVTTERNAYGRQIHSFATPLASDAVGSVAGVFIRAPRLRDPGPRVEVLARHDGDPVLVREGRVVAATFHPELAGDPALHAWFLATCVAVRPVAHA